MIEAFESNPSVHVSDADLQRLLGYPRDHVPGDRSRELSAWARGWFGEHGRPWVYLREAKLELSSTGLRLDGVAFHSRQLHDHLTRAEATRAMFVAVSAGAECEEHARQLWEGSKPDEYFFLETFGSAVVEHLAASTSGRVCDLGAHDGLIAVPHYSPGYSGWDVVDQRKLFDLIRQGATKPFPGPLDVLASGMTRPKKSLLGVFGLTARTPQALDASRATPCENCSFSPCQYRRAPHRGSTPPPTAPATHRAATYTVNARALAKWARERVRFEEQADGGLVASFRFDGTTCSNLGRPLAFDYTIKLGPAEDGHPIRESTCCPASGDEGYKQMCAYLSDGPALMQAIATEKPLLSQPLGDVLHWTRTAAPSGCHCDAASRAHKWGLALEAIHFALTQRHQSTPRPESITISS